MSLLLEVMYGEEIFNDANAKVSVFAVPCKVFNTFDREMFIDTAARKADSAVRLHNSSGAINAYNETFRDDLGKWYQATYKVTEGQIFKVFARRHLGHGLRIVNANQFIRIRAGAAYREIRVPLTQNPKARFQFAIIKGCFDLLTPAQAESKGVKLNAMFRHTFDDAEVARIMQFKVIQAETDTPVIVKEKTVRRGNEEIIVRRTRKARAIDLED